MKRTYDFICGHCGRTYSLDNNPRFCLRCDGPLILCYHLDALSETITSDSFSHRGKGVWRYSELLPEINDRSIISLGEGGTALLQCQQLAQKLNMKKLYVKNETTNPTGSFLDRGMTVDISMANNDGFTSARCFTASGNFAASASAYASRAGFSCSIHMPRGRIDKFNLGKLYQIIAYGGKLTIEDVLPGKINRLISDKKSYLLSPANPYFAEGEKTTAYEICEQRGWRAPDRIIVPMGHGEHIAMIWKGIKELEELGLVDGSNVALTGVQVENYASIVDRIQDTCSDEATDDAKTIAIDLAMDNPIYDEMAIQAIKESKGEGVKVRDVEILEAMTLLARTEGIFAEPSAASTIAGLKKLIEQ
ncbi:MAG: threonine synthase, partial [Candidatus Ranarchaeia archaeon]